MNIEEVVGGDFIGGQVQLEAQNDGVIRASIKQVSCIQKKKNKNTEISFRVELDWHAKLYERESIVIWKKVESPVSFFDKVKCWIQLHKIFPCTLELHIQSWSNTRDTISFTTTIGEKGLFFKKNDPSNLILKKDGSIVEPS